MCWSRFHPNSSSRGSVLIDQIIFPVSDSSLFIRLFSYIKLFSRGQFSQMSDDQDYELIIGGWCDEGGEGGQGGAKPIWTFPHYKVGAVSHCEVKIFK